MKKHFSVLDSSDLDSLLLFFQKTLRSKRVISYRFVYFVDSLLVVCMTMLRFLRDMAKDKELNKIVPFPGGILTLSKCTMSWSIRTLFQVKVWQRAKHSHRS
jgi:hypothetical protein